MAKTKIKKNDDVLVIAGKFRGSTGRVLDVDRKHNRVTIDKINIVKKHVKPTQTNPDGGIQEFEAPIHISNIKLNTKSDKKALKAKLKRDASKKNAPKRTSVAAKEPPQVDTRSGKATQTKEVNVTPSPKAPLANKVQAREGAK